MKKALTTILSVFIALGTVYAGSNALAVDEYNTSTGTTVEGQGVGLRANDTVALFSSLKVTPGFAKFTVVHDNVAYYFSDAMSMKKFSAAPEKFMAQYGGYCAFGVAKGKKLDGSPRYADVVKGKLYLFLNAAVFEAYKKDKQGTLKKAEAQWPGIEHRSVKEVNGL